MNKHYYYSHALLRIHVIGGQRSVRIAPPSVSSSQQSSNQGLPSSKKVYHSKTLSTCTLTPESSCSFRWLETCKVVIHFHMPQLLSIATIIITIYISSQKATESWAGPGKEASQKALTYYSLISRLSRKWRVRK